VLLDILRYLGGLLLKAYRLASDCVDSWEHAENFFFYLELPALNKNPQDRTDCTNTLSLLAISGLYLGFIYYSSNRISRRHRVVLLDSFNFKQHIQAFCWVSGAQYGTLHH
jgi:hypothetical protein